jgi:NADPH2:quinone reductase
VRAVRVHRHGEPRDVVVVEDVDTPEPGPGQVRVRVGAAALNLPDAMLCRGGYQLHPELPFTPGLEAAGTIVALGDGVDPALEGRRVVAVPELPYGALAQESLLPAARAYPVPDAIGDAEAAATLIAFTTAHVSLHRRGGIKKGETLLVHAASGGAGSAAVQMGVLAGARVIATAGGAEKLARCRELGADVVVDYRTDDFVDAVLEATGGRGADLVYDPVGGDVFERSRRCIANEGRLLVIGFASGTVPQVSANVVLYRNYSVVGVYMGAYSRDEAGRAFMLDVHRELMELLAAGSIDPSISREVPLDGVADALTDLSERRVMGKVVVRP